MNEIDFERKLEEIKSAHDAERKKFYQAMNMAGISYWEYDMEHNICRQTQRGSLLYGLPVLIENFDTVLFESGVVADASIPVYKKMLRELKHGSEFVSADIQLKNKFGELEWHNISYCPIHDEEGKTIHAVGFSSHSSHLEKKQDVLPIQEIHETEKEFLSYIVHDVENLQHLITDMLIYLKDHVDREGKEYLDKAQITSDYLQTLINRIWDISEKEKNNTEFWKKELIREQLLQDLESKIRPLAAQKGILLTFRTANVVGKRAYTDTDKLTQIMQNLLFCAVNCTKEGGNIEFIIASTIVDTNQLQMCFTIKGSGIEEHKEKIKELNYSFEKESIENRTLAHGKDRMAIEFFLASRLIKFMNGSMMLCESKEDVKLQIEFMFECVDFVTTSK